ncbi:MAG TPA: KTSC domain-containing protein [Paludibaculum sp.]|jgi:hypothetical protein
MNPFLLVALKTAAESLIEEVTGEKRAPVVSSSIAVVGWKSGTLTVEFRNGGVYEYSGVPASVYEAFISSGSKGRFFRTMVKGAYGSSKR